MSDTETVDLTAELIKFNAFLDSRKKQEKVTKALRTASLRREEAAAHLKEVRGRDASAEEKSQAEIAWKAALDIETRVKDGDLSALTKSTDEVPAEQQTEDPVEQEPTEHEPVEQQTDEDQEPVEQQTEDQLQQESAEQETEQQPEDQAEDGTAEVEVADQGDPVPDPSAESQAI